MTIPSYLKILNFLIPVSLRRCAVTSICLGLRDFLGRGCSVLTPRQSPTVTLHYGAAFWLPMKIWFHSHHLQQLFFLCPSLMQIWDSAPFLWWHHHLPQSDNDPLKSFEEVINVFEDPRQWEATYHQAVLAPSVPKDFLLLSVHTPFPLGFLLTRKSTHSICQRANFCDLYFRPV